MNNPAPAMPPAIHAITPENPPQFPCYAYSRTSGWVQAGERNKGYPLKNLLLWGWTHWCATNPGKAPEHPAKNPAIMAGSTAAPNPPAIPDHSVASDDMVAPTVKPDLQGEGLREADDKLTALANDFRHREHMIPCGQRIELCTRIGEIRRILSALRPVMEREKAKGGLSCFRCDDGHTLLYCLNCADFLLKKEIAAAGRAGIDHLAHELTGDEGDEDGATVLRRAFADLRGQLAATESKLADWTQIAHANLARAERAEATADLWASTFEAWGDTPQKAHDKLVGMVADGDARNEKLVEALEFLREEFAHHVIESDGPDIEAGEWITKILSPRPPTALPQEET